MSAVKLFIGGDFCPASYQPPTPSEGATWCSERFKAFLATNDFNVLNLEAPITSSTKTLRKTGPCLKISPVWGPMLKECGVNVVTLANNHIMDYSEQGFNDTIRVLSNHNIASVGGGADLHEAGKPLFLNAQSSKIAILNFADREFSSATQSKPGANPIDVISNVRAIKAIKESVDFLIVIVHGGHENINHPGIYYRDLLRFYVENGANMVISHHTHVASGYEIYHGSPIFYSLGNFFFPWSGSKPESWYTGIGVQVILDSSGSKFKVMPTCFEKTGKMVDLMDDDEAETLRNNLMELGKQAADDVWLHEWWEEYYRKHSLDKLLSFYKPNRIMRALIRRNEFVYSQYFSRDKLLRLFHLLNCDSRIEHVRSAVQRIIN